MLLKRQNYTDRKQIGGYEAEGGRRADYRDTGDDFGG